MPWERLKPLIELCRSNWGLASQVFADMSLREQSPDVGVQLSELFRASCTGEVAAEILTQGLALDLGDLLPLVRAPTLVLHRRGDAIVPSAHGQKVAAGIPNARFVPLEGTMHAPFQGDSEAVVRAIDDFLGEGEEAAAAPGLATDDVHTILFTDVEGSTVLTQRLGDAKARDVLREHERIVREALKSHGGAEVKTMGDGFMASFSSASKALECAIAMQRAFAKWNAGRGGSRTAPAPEPIRVRIGLNAGEPIAEDDDLFGTAVNEAARITATAKGGEILVSDVVRQLVKGKDFLFVDRGEANLKGFDEPVRLYEARWREESS
jgi:class 3 adenylate cyclase